MRAALLGCLAVGVLVTGPVQAQTNCSGAATQLDATFCAKGGWERADGTLNALWRILKPQADAAGWGSSLLNEQRAWLGRRLWCNYLWGSCITTYTNPR